VVLQAACTQRFLDFATRMHARTAVVAVAYVQRRSGIGRRRIVDHPPNVLWTADSAQRSGGGCPSALALSDGSH
jgi:hypothetical protein